MNKFVSFSAAAALTLAVSLTAVPAFAYDHHHNGGDAVAAGVAGGILGFVAGSAIAGSGGNVHHYYRGESYGEHVDACYRAYHRFYDEDSDTYQARNGRWYPCDL